MAGRALDSTVAAIDIGSTWTKLALYSPRIEKLAEERVRTPLAGEGLYDASTLLGIIDALIGKAKSRGARAIGISLFRASPLAFAPGGRPLSPIVSWLAWRERAEAHSSMPLAGKILSRLPLLGKALRPESPLPIIAWLSRQHPEARAWTLDSLLLERYEGRYESTYSHAALTGAVSPWSLKPMGWALRAAGAPRGFQAPRIVHDRIEGKTLSAVTADQQAAMIGSSCTSPDCVKITLSTGCFADRPLPGRLPRRLGGHVPLIIPLPSGYIYGLEASVPGLGLALEWAAQALGGFERLQEATPSDCREWRGQLLLRTGKWPGQTLLLLGPGRPRSPGEIVCAAIAGAALQCAAVAVRLGEARRYAITGGAASIPLLLRLLSALLPGRSEYCGRDASLRGVAMLAAGIEPPPGAGGLCKPLGRGGVVSRRIGGIARALGDLSMEDVRLLVIEALGAGT